MNNVSERDISNSEIYKKEQYKRIFIANGRTIE